MAIETLQAVFTPSDDFIDVTTTFTSYGSVNGVTVSDAMGPIIVSTEDPSAGVIRIRPSENFTGVVNVVVYERF